MTKRWSIAFSERYQVILDPELIDWLDSGYALEGNRGEFSKPLDPQVLLEAVPEPIWAGFMLPDTLPLIGNHYGDWLCLRVGPDSRVSEVVYWYHGGGDWVPFGPQLSHALLFDSIRSASPSSYYVTESKVRSTDLSNCPLAQWATEHLPLGPNEIARLEDSIANRPHGETLTTLLEHGISREAVMLELIVKALHWPLRTNAAPSTARRLSVPWEPDLVRWMFDAQLVPQEVRAQLEPELVEIDASWDYQDWTTAERLALSISETRPDLGWAHEIAGWAAERRGDVDNAVVRYLRGVQASVFSDQSIRLRTHWFGEAFQKFSADRLYEISKSGVRDWQDDAYLRLLWSQTPSAGKEGLTTFWLHRADDHLAAGRYGDAYDSYYRAGWDLGSHRMPVYRQILEGLISSAQSAGWTARAAVAKTHLDCLAGRSQL